MRAYCYIKHLQVGYHALECTISSDINKISTTGTFTLPRYDLRKNIFNSIIIEQLRNTLADERGVNVTGGGSVGGGGLNVIDDIKTAMKSKENNTTSDRDLKDLFRKGDEIEIIMGYIGDDNNSFMNFTTDGIPSNVSLKNNIVRQFYVDKVTYSDSIVTIHFEDYMLNLRNPGMSFRSTDSIIKQGKLTVKPGLRQITTTTVGKPRATSGKLVFMSYDKGKISLGNGNKEIKTSHISGDIIKTLKNILEIEYPNINLITHGLSLPLEKYKFPGNSFAQILDSMRKNLIKSHFFGKDLHIFLPYEKAAIERANNTSKSFNLIKDGYTDKWNQFNFSLSWSHTKDSENSENQIFYQPIISHDLDYYNSNDVSTQVVGKNYKANGKFDEGKYPDDDSQYDKTIQHFASNLSDTEFKKELKEKYDKYNVSGFEGSFETFGSLPDDDDEKYDHNTDKTRGSVRQKSREIIIGDRISIIKSNINDNRDPYITEDDIKDDEYLVEQVEHKYSRSSGIRQNITIGRKIV